MAYSYPNVDAIITWQFLRDMAGYNANGDGAPQDRYFLERRLNENSTEFAHLGYPGYPNAAGIAWIEMIKVNILNRQYNYYFTL